MLENHISNNPRLIRALRRQPVDRTPVWIMRQAGRYLPEYRAVRSSAKDFVTLLKTPELACKVTLQPLQRFPLDAAILFSDILTIPDAFGMGLYFEEGAGPRFKNPITSSQEIYDLRSLDPNCDLKYVMDTIRMVRHSLAGDIPLIGFSGSPWTIACYMLENGGSKHFNIIKKLMYQEPETLHYLLNHLSEAVIAYLKAQIEAGVQVIMLFDTWGGVLSPVDYLTFSLHYMEKIIKGLNNGNQNNAPVILFTKNGGQCLQEIAQSGTDAIGLDWNANLTLARQIVQDKVALQGNMDPAILYAKPDIIQNAVRQVLEEFGPGPGHIFNLGHGILPDVPIESVEILIETVHRESPKFHQRS